MMSSTLGALTLRADGRSIVLICAKYRLARQEARCPNDPLFSVLPESRVPTLGAISSQRHQRMHVRTVRADGSCRCGAKVPKALVGGDHRLVGTPERGPR